MTIIVRHMNITIFFVFLVFFGVVSIRILTAQQIDFGNTPHNTSAKIEIKGDEFFYDENALIARFRGNVRLEQDQAILLSDEITIYYEKQGVPKELIATGNITITRGLQSAKAAHAVYKIPENILEISGKKVIVISDENVLSGKKFIIDIAKGTGIMSGGTSIVLQPQGAQ